MDVSLRLLRAFLAVAEERHVGRAAQRLFISQPALSQDVRRLERELGVTLFTRSRAGMTPTPAGEEFAAEVRRALEILDRAVAAARAEPPTLTLAYTPSIGNRLMPLLLPELERARPGLRVEERELDTGEVGPAVESGRFDLGLAHCPDPSPRLSRHVLADVPLVVALGAAHPLAREDAVDLRELSGLDLLIWPREVAPAYFDRLLEICRAAGLDPALRTGPRRALTRAYVLASGTAFALLPGGAAHLAVPGVVFLPPRAPGATVTLELLTRRSDPRPEVAAAVTTLRQASRALL
ncbi:LysR family transcriptional regulator [Bailinhaonella thermotolerans]|nr:LysR family transcriptional regulator [Bailinhaonella thermotolerans]